MQQQILTICLPGTACLQQPPPGIAPDLLELALTPKGLAVFDSTLPLDLALKLYDSCEQLQCGGWLGGWAGLDSGADQRCRWRRCSISACTVANRSFPWLPVHHIVHCAALQVSLLITPWLLYTTLSSSLLLISKTGHFGESCCRT